MRLFDTHIAGYLATIQIQMAKQIKTVMQKRSSSSRSSSDIEVVVVELVVMVDVVVVVEDR